MKLPFDRQQQFQLDAVSAVVDLFDGQPLSQGEFEISLSAPGEVSKFQKGHPLEAELAAGT